MGRGADQHVTLAAGGVPQDRHEALVAERLDPGLALANHALGMSALLRADEEPLRVNASDQPETGYAALPTSRPAQLCVAEAPVGAPAAAPVGAGASGSGGDAPAAAEGAVGSSAGELPRQIAWAWSGSMPSPHMPRAGIAMPCAHRPTGNRPSTSALLRLAPLLLCWVRAEQDGGGHATGARAAGAGR